MNYSLHWSDLRNYLILLAIFLLIDLVWLMGIAKRLYADKLGYLMAPKPNLLAALLFYLLFIVGLQVFVVQPALLSGSWKAALLPGLLFGLVTYATYDLTNMATLKDWPLLVTVVDLAWGTFISLAVSLITYLIRK